MWWPIKVAALFVHGTFPFLYASRNVFRNFNLIRGPWAYFRDLRRYNRAAYDHGAFPISVRYLYPVFYDRYSQAGAVPRHYFFQDLWAARKVCQSRVEVHYDVGSRLDGFIAHCLAFCRVVMLDIRPLPMHIDHLEFLQTDCTSMTNIPSESIASLSALHSVEHFGLGRYDDPIDPLAYERAMSEFRRVLAPGGSLYFSVPIGRERLEFNAHRVFSHDRIVQLFSGLELMEFSTIGDDGVLRTPADPQSVRAAMYACGLYHFRKAPGC